MVVVVVVLAFVEELAGWGIATSAWGSTGSKDLAAVSVSGMWVIKMAKRSRTTKTAMVILNLHLDRLLFLQPEDAMSFGELGKRGLLSASSGDV